MLIYCKTLLQFEKPAIYSKQWFRGNIMTHLIDFDSWKNGYIDSITGKNTD